MRKLTWLLLIATGCEKNDPNFCRENPGATGCADLGDADVADDSIDADPTVDARLCFGTGTYAVCLTAPPMAPLVLNPGLLDTGTFPLCLTDQPTDWAGNQPDACFLIGTTISVPALNVTGPRPLVLLASTTISINGILDVASRNSGTVKTGPGSPATECGTYNDDPADSTSGAGGGAGGSFVTIGGNGGNGNGAADSGGTALAALPAAPTMRLRAGCPGQLGGLGENGSEGPPGGGGGAVYLVAGTSIAFADNAAINASGAGAGKAGRQGGGGGGGSGGMIVLDAPTFSVGSMVTLMANGGGGASGGNDTGGCGCFAGSDPLVTDPLSSTPGGSGGGGAGGTGFAEGAPAVSGNPGTSNLGGGGGGGGGGYIQTTTAIVGATLSPAPVVFP